MELQNDSLVRPHKPTHKPTPPFYDNGFLIVGHFVKKSVKVRPCVCIGGLNHDAVSLVDFQ